jgi:type 1 glutamine amidotransferase
MVMLVAALLSTHIVVVTATAGFRHDSIPTAEQVIATIGERTRWFDVTFVREESQMPAALSAEALADVKLVMFVNTTGKLAPESRAPLLAWIRNGGTFLGVHSASDTWHDSPDYIEMLGGEFDSHPKQQLVSIVVNDRGNAATAVLESPHPLFEEIYRLKNFDASRVQLLLSIDPSLPLAWTKRYGNGRVFYTALGHRIDVWTSPWFQQHLTGAIGWALHRDAPPKRRTAAP